MSTIMAQQEQSGGGGGGSGSGQGGGGGGVRRRSMESPMKVSQARTKVVLRHLPPSISEAVLLEHIDSKFTGCYSWFSFRAGKTSVRKQVPSRAYINFKKPEDVYDFSEHLDGHVFVNEKGTHYKVGVEYAPYQRIPKPRSKKDIREGTITKDPDYLDFLEMLGKPLEFLPSAEVQLERREAEKAAVLGAGGGKETVVTPLMEFVRQRRATKSAPQRSLSSKMVSRSVGLSAATSNSISHKRGLERSRSCNQMDFKEVQARDHSGGQLRREEQRKEREAVIERRRKEITETKDRKRLHGDGTALTIISGTKGNATTFQIVESSKENAGIAVLSKDSLGKEAADGELEANGDQEPVSSHTPAVTGKFSTEGPTGDAAKDLKQEVLKWKQLSVMKEKAHKDSTSEGGPMSPGQVSVIAGGYTPHNRRHRLPVSLRVNSTSTQSQLPTSGEGSTGGTPLKLSQQRREGSMRNSSWGAVSPRDQQSPSHVTSLQDSPFQQRGGSPQPAERGGKRPPRPQNTRMTSKEQALSPVSPAESDQVGSSPSSLLSMEVKSESCHASGSDRQDARRVRNKDRPDRPVWTPRRRSDSAQSSDPSSSALPATAVLSEKREASKLDKSERGLQRQVAKAVSTAGQNVGAESKVTNGAAGQQQSDVGGRSQLGTATQVGKSRHVESGSTRSASGGQSALSGSNVASNQDYAGGTIQDAEERSYSSVSGTTVDPKAAPITLYNTRENVGSYRSGDRRRERSGQHSSRDSDGSVVAAELSKPAKRGGSLSLGSSEKQVWVAVQKAG